MGQRKKEKKEKMGQIKYEILKQKMQTKYEIHTYLLENFIFDSERYGSEYCKGVEPNQALIDNFCSIF